GRVAAADLLTSRTLVAERDERQAPLHRPVVRLAGLLAGLLTGPFGRGARRRGRTRGGTGGVGRIRLGGLGGARGGGVIRRQQFEVLVGVPGTGGERQRGRRAEDRKS